MGTLCQDARELSLEYVVENVYSVKALSSLDYRLYKRHNCGIADSLSDTSIIEIYRDYRIRANRLGLYTLASSVTGVLSGVNGSEKGDGVTVFALDVGSHALRVELVD